MGHFFRYLAGCLSQLCGRSYVFPVHEVKTQTKRTHLHPLLISAPDGDDWLTQAPASSATEQKTGWTAETVWTFWRFGIRTPNRPVPQPSHNTDYATL